MYQRILVPVDGSPTSHAGLLEAMKFARLTGARLRLLHVVDEMPYVLSAGGYAPLSSNVFDLMRDAGEKILNADRDEVERAGIEVDTALYDSLSGRLSERVAEEAVKWSADLIVIGTHGRRGLRRAVIGSDAEQIVRTSSVPVLLVRDRSESAPAQGDTKPD
ncbi:MAG TPA: universal stress protein [Burkholderiaceae bacterium]|jgi:nucleotide-binding universal stress UspA family protein|nr:universal stress protein [Burkholderiaceae bacterium]